MKPHTYLPTVLIVDDDSAVTSYLRKSFHDQTPMGVLTANTMRDARTLLEMEDLPIDVVVADLFFEMSTRDRENDLIDGIDLLKLAKDIRPDADRYVFSMWTERDSEREKAKALGLDIRDWFHKMFYDPSLKERTPWNHIYREQLLKQLNSNEDLFKEFKKKGLNEEDKLNTIGAFFEQMAKPKTTFLQDLNDDRYVLKKPIRVRWSSDEDDRFIARDMSIGLLTEGIGETLDEALEDLSRHLMSEKEMLDEDAGNLKGFAQLVKERLDSHLGKRAKKDDAKIENVATLLGIAALSIDECYSDPVVQLPAAAKLSVQEILDKVRQKLATDPESILENEEKEELQANRDRLRQIAQEEPTLSTIALDTVGLIDSVIELIP